MSWIPGWDSLAGAGWWSGFYFWAGIIALIGLGITEVASHRYSDRKDELAAAEQKDIERRHDEDMARVQRETAQANERAAQLEKEAAEARAQAAQAELTLEREKRPRTLSLERQQLVADNVRQYAGQQYRVAVSSAADDGIDFWESLYAALEQAGWVYIPMPPGQPAVGKPGAGIPIAAAPGVEILFNPADENNMLGPALALGNAIHADGTVVAVNRDNVTNPIESPGVLFIRIGARVPPP